MLAKRLRAATAETTMSAKDAAPTGWLVGAGLRRSAGFRGAEGLSAAAAGHGVGVAKGEPAAHERVDEVDLGALEVHRAHRIDHDAHAVLIDDRVVLLGAVSEGHSVGEARAATRRDVYAQREVAPLLLRDDLAELVRRA